MKKIFILIVFLIVLTGCEATYTIEINGLNFNETLEINDRVRRHEEQIRESANANIPTDVRLDQDGPRIEGVDYYRIDLIDTTNNFGLRYNSRFNLEGYRFSTIANNYVSPFRLSHANGIIEMSVGDQQSFQIYPNLNRITIRLVTSNNVLSHNADEVNNGVLYWFFTRENYQNKNIDVRLTDEIYNPTGLWQLNDDGFIGANTLMAIYLIIFALIIIIGIVILGKFKNSNL